MAEENGFVASFLGKFTVLKGAVRELWIIFGCKILTIVAYGLVNSTLVLWLSSDLGYSDVRAGFVIATWSTMMTLFTVMIGSLVDAIGLRKAFLIGFGACLFARAVMAFFVSRWIALPLGLLPLALGEALMTPVMVAAVKRFATTAQRSMSFSIFYAMMNVGFAISGYTFDKVRTGLGEYGHYQLPLMGVTLSTYQTLILLGFLFTLPNLLIVYFWLRGGVEVTDQGVKITPEQSKYPDEALPRAIALSCRDALKDWARIFSNLWTQPAFYRFLVFLTLVVGVRLIFYHMHYTFPKYGIRELGEGAPIGRIFGVLNPVLIVILVPIVGALTQKMSAYRTVIIGSFIAASSVFFMAVPPTLFQPLADGWLGDLVAHRWFGIPGPVNPLYVSIVLSMVVLSIGEAFYSPRLYEYPAAIAPKGQEGSYMALSLLPFFVAKFFVGTLSGFLLQSFCPAVGPRSSGTMWLIIGLMAMMTPAGLLIFRRYVQVHEAGRQE
ncbi:MAG TPA: MFS transporter [Elusimicrobia bacterium]|nr:MFS transporter [Elusimicrobiota bacterium]HBT61422.1 MFS transporter [Elusimicrobiota bacterium]